MDILIYHNITLLHCDSSLDLCGSFLIAAHNARSSFVRIIKIMIMDSLACPFLDLISFPEDIMCRCWMKWEGMWKRPEGLWNFFSSIKISLNGWGGEMRRLFEVHPSSQRSNNMYTASFVIELKLQERKLYPSSLSLSLPLITSRI